MRPRGCSRRASYAAALRCAGPRRSLADGRERREVDAAGAGTHGRQPVREHAAPRRRPRRPIAATARSASSDRPSSGTAASDVDRPAVTSAASAASRWSSARRSATRASVRARIAASQRQQVGSGALERGPPPRSAWTAARPRHAGHGERHDRDRRRASAASPARRSGDAERRRPRGRRRQRDVEQAQTVERLRPAAVSAMPPPRAAVPASAISVTSPPVNGRDAAPPAEPLRHGTAGRGVLVRRPRRCAGAATATADRALGEGRRTRRSRQRSARRPDRRAGGRRRGRRRRRRGGEWCACGCSCVRWCVAEVSKLSPHPASVTLSRG